MIEHRLIERMIALIEQRAGRAVNEKTLEVSFVDAAVDFVRMYADRTHHGKEEDILFRELSKKRMSEEDLRVMNELVEEHKLGRKAVGELVAASEDYKRGVAGSLDRVIEKMKFLAQFYPVHIEKEDKLFFPASMKYLSDSENDGMLEEMRDFDRMMIHEKYKAVVKSFG